MNTTEITEIARQAPKICERIASLTISLGKLAGKDERLQSTYSDMRINELEQLQHLTLELTRLIVGDEPDHEDEGEGNVFFGGELDHKKKDEKEVLRP